MIRRNLIRTTQAMLCLRPNTPSVSTGPCPLTVAGPYSAWMPRKSLHGRTCGVSCDGERARTCRDTRCVWPQAKHGLRCSDQVASDQASLAGE
ncbi:hypothetical protein XaCFBP7622_01965 [Xanthomonas arboricola]|nr:hypothetical protein XaCFBP7622_01965 [Xanthomonas arboricola]